ncbi:MAG: radical SAM protein [archaeon]
MEFDRPNPAANVMLFKKELWIREYSTRMQRFLSGEKLAPVRIDAELHRRCNLGCVHCIRRSSDHDMTEESKRIEVPERRWVEIARESGRMGTRAWNIAGIGEPMCKPELTLKVMKTIKEHKMFGELTTNGTLWDDSQIRTAVRIGWDSIGFSVDAADAGTHDRIRNKTGVFEKVTGTIRRFDLYRKEIGTDKPGLTVNMVLNALNYRMLPDMIRMTARLGADAIFVEPMIVHSDKGEEIRIRGEALRELPGIIDKAQNLAKELNILTYITCLDGDDEKKEFNSELVEKTSDIREVIINAAQEKKEKAVAEKLRDLFSRKEEYKPRISDDAKEILEIPCYYPWFYLMINADGSVVHCGECRDFRDNIRESSLEQIWFGEHLQELRASYRNRELPQYCRRCRPNVIGDMKLVRKSIKEYTDVEHMQRKLVSLFKDNILLKEGLYYAKTGKEPWVKERRALLEKARVFRF